MRFLGFHLTETPEEQHLSITFSLSFAYIRGQDFPRKDATYVSTWGITTSENDWRKTFLPSRFPYGWEACCWGNTLGTLLALALTLALALAWRLPLTLGLTDRPTDRQTESHNSDSDSSKDTDRHTGVQFWASVSFWPKQDLGRVTCVSSYILEDSVAAGFMMLFTASISKHKLRAWHVKGWPVYVITWRAFFQRTSDGWCMFLFSEASTSGRREMA